MVQTKLIKVYYIWLREVWYLTLLDWENVKKKKLRYLKGNPNYGIKYTNDKNLKIFVDAYYAGDETTRIYLIYIMVPVQ